VQGDRGKQMELELKRIGDDNVLGAKIAEMMLKARADREKAAIEQQKAQQKQGVNTQQ